MWQNLLFGNKQPLYADFYIQVFCIYIWYFKELLYYSYEAWLNSQIIQINDEYYEDLTVVDVNEILDDLKVVMKLVYVVWNESTDYE